MHKGCKVLLFAEGKTSTILKQQLQKQEQETSQQDVAKEAKIEKQKDKSKARNAIRQANKAVREGAKKRLAARKKGGPKLHSFGGWVASGTTEILNYALWLGANVSDKSMDLSQATEALVKEYGPQVKPLAKKVKIPLLQHIGKPAEPIVKQNEIVERGKMIGKMSDDVLGANIHASISGKVKKVTKEYILIEA